ncbi:MAG: type II toxin-antitoxin system RelE/ParE family toxin [Chloroflexota bacterium]
MSYRVELTALAKADANTAFERIRQVAPYGGERWLRGLFTAILTLADMPARCPVIPEADELGFPARHCPAPDVRQTQRGVPSHLRHSGGIAGRTACSRAAHMARLARRYHCRGHRTGTVGENAARHTW